MIEAPYAPGSDSDHATAAYSLAYRIAGARGAAEDVTQEAFISIWRSGARYDRTRGSVRAWTLGIVRNRAIDALRREGGDRPDLARDDEAILEQRPAGELTEEEAVRREQAHELRGALAELPNEQSKVIQLAYFGGFSHSEIAAMLGMPLGTVKGRMRLGMEKVPPICLARSRSRRGGSWSGTWPDASSAASGCAGWRRRSSCCPRASRWSSRRRSFASGC